MSAIRIKGKSWLVMLLLIFAAMILPMMGVARAQFTCVSCHGTGSASTADMRPLDSPFRNPSSGGLRGNHRNHMGFGATAITCAKCHPGSDTYSRDHRDGLIKISSKINNSPGLPRYRNITSYWPQSSNPSLGTCNNVNCHFENITPEWGSTPFNSTTNCSSCHQAPPTDGQHPSDTTKHGKYYGTGLNSCAYCHSDHTKDKFGNLSTLFAHATSAGKRPLVVRFAVNGIQGGSYSGYAGNNDYNAYLPSQTPSRNGECSGLYCHSDGLKNTAPFNPPGVTPKWGDSNYSCISCHKGRVADNIAANCLPPDTWITNDPKTDNPYCSKLLNMTSGGHAKLADARWIRKYPCSYCHGATVRAKPRGIQAPIDDESSLLIYSGAHVNGSKNIRINTFWKIDGIYKTYTAPYYNPNDKVCYNLYCHSDGAANPDSSEYKKFAWNRKDITCNSCHGHDTNSNCISCHDGARKFPIFNGLKNFSTVLSIQTGWATGEQWKSAMPMYANEGPGSLRPNSHPRHLQNNFSCTECHLYTISASVTGDCSNTTCHGTTAGNMASESSHINALYHVNKVKDVKFKRNGTYNNASQGQNPAKSCSGTDSTWCHGSNTPVWGSSVNSLSSSILCYNCHMDMNNPGVDRDVFGSNSAAKLSSGEWLNRGHGRRTGVYDISLNPAANFPDPTSGANPCWYCHDNKIMHRDSKNPFRLKLHDQFSRRFEKECVYCHMTRADSSECLGCHNNNDPLNPSMAPQIVNLTGTNVIRRWANRTTTVIRPPHNGFAGISCLADQATKCHSGDEWTHNTRAGIWYATQKADVKNQYLMMGVCLQCHDDDSSNKCAGCHGIKAASGTNVLNGYQYTDATFTTISVSRKYKLGYDPGTGFRKPQKARASSAHFGHKHYQGFLATGGWLNMTGAAKGKWKGGKFCWDCHDPHGDSNIYMIQDKITIESDGKYGMPTRKVNGTFNRSAVNFKQKSTGGDYVKKTGNTPIDGICNVCHTAGTQHWNSTGQPGNDSHNYGTPCTKCHEHRFTDSHADGQSCNACHQNKPVPRHSAFGLPVDCVKCHDGYIGNRADIMGQFKGQSHHVQGTPVTNKQCYQCHWESTSSGTINSLYHEGYSFVAYTSQKDKKVDLVIYGPGVRPTVYRPVSSSAGRATVAVFTAANLGVVEATPNTERKEAASVTNHCLGCHSDQNNFTKPFNDCKTPIQYAWDRQSIDSRYSQKNTTKWGKYSSTTVNAKYKVTKSLSAHGNAANNQGGWNPTTGTDSSINNYRAGFTGFSAARKNVQCFDCHNSHGSKASGVTSSYLSYSGTRGGNLKETSVGKGGYKVKYSAQAGGNATYNSVVINPYNSGAGLCFDCHMTATKAASGDGVPWGYQSTFGASMPIKGYRDGYLFGNRNYASDPNGSTLYKLGGGANNFNFKQGKAIQGGHMHASKTLNVPASDNINGLCTPCHDPHGVSTTLGLNQKYGVPLLKGTWLSSPYKEDFPPPDPYTSNASHPDAVTGLNLAWGTSYLYGNSGQWRNSPNSNTTVNAPPVTFNIDRNTFNTTSSTTGYGRGGSVRRLSETDTQFAGLCMTCHSKKNLMGRYTSSITGTSAYRPNQARWSSVARIHASNSGWGTNKEHSFTCSKCHQPHNSGLPRLMQTNCLDYRHRGGRSDGKGQPWNSRKTMNDLPHPSPPDNNGLRSYQLGNDQLRGYPIASIYGANTKGQSQYYGGKTYPIPAADAACHLTRPGTGIATKNTWPATWSDDLSNTPTIWPNSNYWNNVTPW